MRYEIIDDGKVPQVDNFPEFTEYVKNTDVSSKDSQDGWVRVNVDTLVEARRVKNALVSRVKKYTDSCSLQTRIEHLDDHIEVWFRLIGG